MSSVSEDVLSLPGTALLPLAPVFAAPPGTAQPKVTFPLQPGKPLEQ